MTFKINGVDFSGYITKYGYETSRAPVILKTYQDLAGYTHEIVSRWKSALKVTLNPLTQDQVNTLSRELLQRTVTVTYYNAQMGREVTETMKCVTPRSVLALVKAAENWWEAGALQFEQR